MTKKTFASLSEGLQWAQQLPSEISLFHVLPMSSSSTAGPTSVASPPSPGDHCVQGVELNEADLGVERLRATSTWAGCLSDSIYANPAYRLQTHPWKGRKGQLIEKKRCSMSQGVAADLNRNKAACVFSTYSKSKS